MTGGTSRWAAAIAFFTLFASTTHTIEDNQRRGWVLRLTLDKQGVRGFDTRVVKISFDSIPTLDRTAASPCWNRGNGGGGLCRGNERGVRLQAIEGIDSS